MKGNDSKGISHRLADTFLSSELTGLDSSSFSIKNDPKLYLEFVSELNHNSKLVEDESCVKNVKRKRNAITEAVEHVLIEHAKDPVAISKELKSIPGIDDFSIEYKPMSFHDESYISLMIHITICEHRPIDDRKTEVKFRINWKIKE